MIIIGGGSVSSLGQATPASWVLETPGASEDMAIFYAQEAITIARITVVLTGSTPSVTWTLRHDLDRSQTGTEVITGGSTSTSTGTGDIYTSLNNPNN